MELRPFGPADQRAARELILAGLGEHWGHVDPTLNPDLEDIAVSYARGYFAVAFEDGALIGTGAFLPLDDGAMRIHRMSVASHRRRRGVGSALLAHLLAEGRRRGYRRVVLETTASWSQVVAFYRARGFVPWERRGDELFFTLTL